MIVGTMSAAKFYIVLRIGLIWSGRLLGIYYFDYDEDSRSIIISTVALVYSTLVGIFYLVSSPITMWGWITTQLVVKSGTIEGRTTFLQISTEILVLFVIVVYLFANIHAYKDVINQGLKMYDEVLKNGSIAIHESEPKFMRQIMFKIIFAIISTTSLIGAIFLNASEMPIFRVLILQSNIIATNSMNLVVSMYYFCGMLFIAHLFRGINRKLQNLLRQLHNPETLHPGEFVIKCCELSDEIDRLSIMHDKLCSFTNKLNRFFAPHTFIMFLHGFMAFVSQVSVVSNIVQGQSVHFQILPDIHNVPDVDEFDIKF